MPVKIRFLDLPAFSATQAGTRAALTGGKRKRGDITPNPATCSSTICLHCYTACGAAAAADCKEEPGEEVLAGALFDEYPTFPAIHQLASLHPHALDSTIRFREDTHKYFVVWFLEKGQFTSTNTVSVSGFVHDYFPHFDADEVIAKMMKGRRWNSANKYWGMSPGEIKQLWASKGEVASSQGSKFHYLIECFYNGMDLAPYRHFRVIRQFLRWHSSAVAGKLRPFRTEMRLRSGADLRLTGTIDMLYVEPDHPPPEETGGVLRLHMKDWKISREIRRENPYGRGFGPCAGMPDCNFSHYTLQLNSYQTMLETHYTNFRYRGCVYPVVRVLSRELVVFHDERTEAEVVPVPRCESTIKEMMARRVSALAASSEPDEVVAEADLPPEG